ncbi:unnamed protein product [Symbiodinium natans]|uniref:Uncharacterized protein n=1 Tax=Symbiodinium natans TaxID=878477 RepID=A0A812ML05_9DINO|nr:unnamed protein product [Symbiodinium natans]
MTLLFQHESQCEHMPMWGIQPGPCPVHFGGFLCGAGYLWRLPEGPAQQSPHLVEAGRKKANAEVCRGDEGPSTPTEDIEEPAITLQKVPLPVVEPPAEQEERQVLFASEPSSESQNLGNYSLWQWLDGWFEARPGSPETPDGWSGSPGEVADLSDRASLEACEDADLADPPLVLADVYRQAREPEREALEQLLDYHIISQHEFHNSELPRDHLSRLLRVGLELVAKPVPLTQVAAAEYTRRRMEELEPPHWVRDMLAILRGGDAKEAFEICQQIRSLPVESVDLLQQAGVKQAIIAATQRHPCISLQGDKALAWLQSAA